MKKQGVSFSLVIATAPGRKKQLHALLTSIYSSTFTDFDVFIIDNSGDKQKLQNLLIDFPNIELIHMPYNTGMFAYNVGFAQAKGKYIFILDDDCLIQKDTLQKIITLFPTLPKKTGVITLNIYDPKANYYSTSHLFQLKSPFVPTLAGGASIIKREVLDEVGYFDDSFFCWQHEDDWSIRLHSKGYTIYFAKEIVLFHDEKIGNVRKLELLYTGRNKLWLNMKHFSLYLLPFLFLRDLLWILTPFHKPFKATLYSLQGYLWGILTIATPLRKRHVAPVAVQKNYIKYYLLGKYVGRLVAEDRL